VQQRLAQETTAKEAEHKERLQTLEKLQAATAAAAALQSDKGELAGQVAAAARTIDELHAASKQREAQFAARDDAAGKAVRLLPPATDLSAMTHCLFSVRPGSRGGGCVCRAAGRTDSAEDGALVSAVSAGLACRARHFARAADRGQGGRARPAANGEPAL
jgi:hypothetical protein